MFYKIITLRLGSQSSAKMAATFYREKLEADGDQLPIRTADVLMDADGHVVLNVACETRADMARFKRYSDALLDELRKSIVVRSEKYSTISVFRYDRTSAKV